MTPVERLRQQADALAEVEAVSIENVQNRRGVAIRHARGRGVSAQLIADTLGVDRSTVYQWAKDGHEAASA